MSWFQKTIIDCFQTTKISCPKILCPKNFASKKDLAACKDLLQNFTHGWV